LADFTRFPISSSYRIWQIFILNGDCLPVLFHVSVVNIKRANWVRKEY